MAADLDALRVNVFITLAKVELILNTDRFVVRKFSAGSVQSHHIML